jgi:hypothetical protein
MFRFQFGPDDGSDNFSRTVRNTTELCMKNKGSGMVYDIHNYWVLSIVKKSKYDTI